MIWLEDYFRANWETFSKAGGEELPERFSFICQLPGFYLSCNLLTQVFVNDDFYPRLIVKVSAPELGAKSFQREFNNLASLSRFPELRSSVPGVFPLARWEDRTLLVQTALDGQAVDARYAVRNRENVQALVQRWLTDLHALTAQVPAAKSGRIKYLLEQPLEAIGSRLATVKGIETLISRARDHTRQLEDAGLPLVFTHGDFSGPNVLMNRGHQVAVVDWEHGNPEGLPLVDLLMWLQFIDASIARSAGRIQESGAGDSLAAASFANRRYVLEYCATLGIPTEALPHLCVAAWSTILAERIEKCAEIDGTLEGSEALSDESVDWLVNDMYFRIWKSLLSR